MEVNRVQRWVGGDDLEWSSHESKTVLDAYVGNQAARGSAGYPCGCKWYKCNRPFLSVKYFGKVDLKDFQIWWASWWPVVFMDSQQLMVNTSEMDAKLSFRLISLLKPPVIPQQTLFPSQPPTTSLTCVNVTPGCDGQHGGVLGSGREPFLSTVQGRTLTLVLCLLWCAGTLTTLLKSSQKSPHTTAVNHLIGH